MRCENTIIYVVRNLRFSIKESKVMNTQKKALSLYLRNFLLIITFLVSLQAVAAEKRMM